jgi:hypothetical protein
MDIINDSDRISREMPEENPDRSLDPASGEALAAWEKEEEDAPAEKTADGERTVDDSTEEDEPEIRIRLPKICFVLFGAAGVALIFYLISLASPAFADWFCRYPAGGVRAALAFLTSAIPFSLAEFLIILLPVIFVYVVAFGIRKYVGSWRNAGVFALTVLSVASLLFTLFVFTLGTGYRGTTLDTKLDIERKKVSADELKQTAQILVDRLNAEREETGYLGDGFSVMPCSYEELNRRLNDAYRSAAGEYGFIQSFRSRVKPVMLSEPWTYTHITGVYTYFTGESNLNVNMPAYTIPFTEAHEMAHQRGIAREDEANFVAFLVCINSDDPYIRYSGYLNMFEYVASPLYSADADAYRALWSSLDPDIRGEMTAYNKFFEKYRKNVAATVSSAINDTYLKSQGTVGEKSYGLVVDLAVAYYRDSFGGQN